MAEVYPAGRKPVVIVTRRLPAPVETRLAEGFDARFNGDDHPFTRAELAAALRDGDALLPTVTDRLDAGLLLAPGRRARILANFGVGTDHIDLAAASRAGLPVTNTPGVLTDAVADLAIALLLMALRRLGEGERELRGGGWTGWRPTHLLGRELRGAVLGIVGMGRIGQAVARRAAAGFGMRVLAAGRAPIPERVLRESGAIERPLDALLAASDVVSLHLPAVPGAGPLLDARRLALMKRGAVLINTARGALVDEEALVAALASGHLGAAGLDVYAREPEVHPGLLALEQVVLLPHLGSATAEARTAMGMMAAANLEAFFRGDPPPQAVGPA